jgi:uncharacterized protein (TIGR00255 family)
MIASMTGFARRELSTPDGSLVCEVRSVNHRYLEVALRLPDELRVLDPELRALLQKELKRGKVDVSVYLRQAGAEGARQLEIDENYVRQLAGQLEALGRLMDVDSARARPAPLDILRFPGVLREQRADAETLTRSAREVFTGALADLVAMRAREGARLAELIQQRCEQLGALVQRVRERLPEVHAAIRGRFAERLAELGSAVDDDRLEQEIVLILQRMDVAEEMDRLEGHLQEIARIVNSPEPAGRRLDFLMQELNREANTLSSKSQDLTTTRAAVDMKVLIEQMREQVQNVE